MRRRWTGFLLIFVLLGLWEAATVGGTMQSTMTPSVGRIFGAWGSMLSDGELVAALEVSLKRLAIGYLLAAAIGVPLGLCMGSFRWAYDLFEPLTELLRPVPPPAYIPIAILIIGFGDEMKIFVVTMSCLFPILLNSYQGVRNIDPVFIDTGRTFGLTRGAILRRIALPAALPSVLTGMRISISVALIVVVVAEMVAGDGGIGYLILDMQRTFHVPEMYAGIFTLAVLGYAINRLFLRAEGLLLRGRAQSGIG